MKQIFVIITFFLAASLFASAQNEHINNFGYTNPVISGMAPDPSVCRVGDDYYLVNSSFIQNPALPLYHSKDLIHWELINYAVTNQNGLDLSKGIGMFAPTIRYNAQDSTFYVICTNVGCGQNFIVYTKNPRSKWSNPVWLKNPKFGIDPSLFFDTDGSCYLQCTGNNNIIQAKINPKTGEELSEIKVITEGLGGRYPEGPHLYKVDSFYYLMLSEGGTEFGHHVNMLRGTSPWGPFESFKGNPILSHVGKNAQNNPIQCTGHADLIQAHDNSWWMVFLASRPILWEFYPLGRETFLAPVEFTNDKWFTVNKTGTVDTAMLVATLPQVPKTTKNDITHTFDAPLSLEWNGYRVSPQSITSIKNGKLQLSANDAYDAFIGVRQLDYTMDAVTQVFLDKDGEAGLCVHHDDGKRYNLGLVKKDGKTYVQSQCLFFSVNQSEQVQIDNKTKSCYLKISARKEMYYFYYSLDNKTWTEVGKMDAHFLAGGFSGLLVGPYSKKGNAEFEFCSFSY